MDFEKICMMFTMEEPYYGILLSSMVRVPDRTIPAPMGVGRAGNVFKLYYNPDWIEKFDVDTILLCLKHEVLHLAFNHFSIFETPPESPQEQDLRNIAADLEVNCYIDVDRMRGIKPYTVDLFGFPRKQGTREYYRLLMSQAQQQAQAQQPQQPCNGGQGGQPQNQNNQSQGQDQNDDGSSDSSQGQDSQNNGQPQSQNNGESGGGGRQKQQQQDFLDSIKDKGQSIDDHSQWPDEEDPQTKEMLQQQIEDMLIFAADEVEKGCGDIPGELVGRINLIRNKKKPKPVADWKRYVRRYLGNEFSEFIRKSKKRESRRFPDAAGNRHRRKSHILVAIDTSGSVSMPEYKEFFGQIQTLTQVATFHVVECDATIQHEYDYRGKPNLTLHGGGGTSFEPVVDMYNKNLRAYDALIYFTDGECSIPRNTPKDTLWVISSKGDQSSRKKYQVNGASVAFIPKKQ